MKKFTRRQKDDLLEAIDMRLEQARVSYSTCPLCLKYGVGVSKTDCVNCPANKKWRYNRSYCNHFTRKRDELIELLNAMVQSVAEEK